MPKTVHGRIERMSYNWDTYRLHTRPTSRTITRVIFRLFNNHIDRSHNIFSVPSSSGTLCCFLRASSWHSMGYLEHTSRELYPLRTCSILSFNKTPLYFACLEPSREARTHEVRPDHSPIRRCNDNSRMRRYPCDLKDNLPRRASCLLSSSLDEDSIYIYIYICMCGEGWVRG